MTNNRHDRIYLFSCSLCRETFAETLNYRSIDAIELLGTVLELHENDRHF